MSIPKRVSTLRKYEAIQKRYNELYQEKRLRMDDCVSKICNEFYMSEKSVWKVLRMELM